MLLLASLYKISLVESENDDYKIDGLFVASIFIKLASAISPGTILIAICAFSNVLALIGPPVTDYLILNY